VIRALQSCGVVCTLLALTAGFGVAKRLGLAPLGYRDFLHLLADPDKAIALGQTLLEGNTHPDIELQESLAYLGVNYSEWVDTYGHAQAAQLYAAGGRRTFLPVRFMGRILDELKPLAVVTTSSPRSERAATEAAVERGIPTLNIMDLFGLPYDIYPRQPVHADRITVMSEFVKDNLVSAGMDAARIRVTGCPGYDQLQDAAIVQAGHEFRRQMGWEGYTVAMYPGYLEDASPVTPDDYLGNRFGLTVERQLREWVAAAPRRALVVRYHPGQYHEFPSLGQQANVYVSNPTQESVAFLVHASDIVLVQTTTVGLEAALVGKRVLCLRFAPSVINLDFDYSRMGLAEPVDTLDGLLPAIENPHPPRCSPRVLPPPGLAAPRVADEIQALRLQP